MPAFPAVVTLAVILWRIQGPSFWRDEAATQSAVHRPFPALLRMLGNVDAVHGAYYALIWVVVRLGGSGELAVRFPSALAMAVAAGCVTALGRRLVSAPAGLAAGLVYAALPTVSWFGQDARPAAAETALAAVASYLFLRVLDADNSAGEQRRWLHVYAVSLGLLGLTDVFGLLLVPAHALTLLLRHRAHPDRRLFLGWLAAVCRVGAALGPLVALAWTQRGQTSWIRPPGLTGLSTLQRLAGSAALCLVVGMLMVGGIPVVALGSRARGRPDWPARLPAFCLPWLVVPPAVLFTVSQVHPVYTFRYIVFCIPAVALLAGAGLAALGRAAGPAVLVLIVLLGMPGQLGERASDGHGDAIRGVDQIVSVQELPGDAVLYPRGPGMRTFAAAYPYGLVSLHDVSLSQTPARSGTIYGTNAPRALVRERLSPVSRVWVAEADLERPFWPGALTGLGFRQVRSWKVSDVWLLLYAR